MKYPIINYGNPMNVSDEWKRRFHADALYLEQSRNLSYYDAIPLPPTTLFMGGSPVTPFVITETDRPVLINFSKIALDHYNQGSDSSFEFVDLVKCSFYNDFRVVPTDVCDLDPAEYYITFQAKDPFDTITIFQTKVLVDQHDKHKLPVVEECRIQI
ncbi:hypothetical protein QL285_080774 [Trifolium repens]|nr:hypothetical protein QL285_080774 [Trifolium repens]